MKLLLGAILFITSLLFFSLRQDAKLEASIKRGKLVFDDFCVSCHLPTGKGVKGTFPPLAGADFLIENRTLSIRGVKFGQKGEILVNGEKYNGFMPPMGLEDDEIADVMNYILNSWGNTSEKIVTEEEVAAITKD